MILYPSITWDRTVMQELQKIKMSWGEAQHAAKDQTRWKELTEAHRGQRGVRKYCF